jgi:hypothetical protein
MVLERVSAFLGIVNKNVQVEGTELSFARGELKDMEAVRTQINTTLKEDERALVIDKEILVLIREVEDDIGALERDLTLERGQYAAQKELTETRSKLARAAKGKDRYGPDTRDMRKLGAQETELMYKLNDLTRRIKYNHTSAQRVVADIQVKIRYIHELLDRGKRLKAFELQQQKTVEGWVSTAYRRTLGIMGELRGVRPGQALKVRPAGLKRTTISLGRGPVR